MASHRGGVTAKLAGRNRYDLYRPYWSCCRLCSGRDEYLQPNAYRNIPCGLHHAVGVSFQIRWSRTDQTWTGGRMAWFHHRFFRGRTRGHWISITCSSPSTSHGRTGAIVAYGDALLSGCSRYFPYHCIIYCSIRCFSGGWTNKNSFAHRHGNERNPRGFGLRAHIRDWTYSWLLDTRSGMVYGDCPHLCSITVMAEVSPQREISLHKTDLQSQPALLYQMIRFAFLLQRNAYLSGSARSFASASLSAWVLIYMRPTI